MNTARILARVLLGFVTIVGLLHGGLFVASALGIARPLVVVSGSMEPEIPTGALVIATPKATAALNIGDVVSVPSPVTDSIVTHRLVDIQVIDGTTVGTLKGDNNQYADPEPYVLADTTWTPEISIPVVGRIMQLAGQPLVLIPLLLGLVSLMGIAFRKPESGSEAPFLTKRHPAHAGGHTA